MNLDRILRPRRARALARPFPEHWRGLLSDEFAHWSTLDDRERSRLEDLIRIFLAEKLFEWVGGMERSEDVEVLTAAGASLLILELGPDYYRDVSAVIVYPSAVVRTGPRSAPHAAGIVTEDPAVLLGEAALHGPVVIAWDAARRNFAHPEDGHNVVFHEFAHKLDMADGTSDGTPPLPASRRDRWIKVCTAVYDDIRSGRHPSHHLDPYAGTNPSEFFAVATEFFFDRPRECRDHTPELYEVLADFYRQDPAQRLTRG